MPPQAQRPAGSRALPRARARLRLAQLLVLMLMAPATAAAQGEQASPAESFSQAQQAYDAGHFDEAAVLFARLARAQPHKAGLQFWWAYAAYRAGDLGQAAGVLEGEEAHPAPVRGAHPA